MKRLTSQRLVATESLIGFTLAELLISLAILGVIATFTIPKILGAAGNGQNTAIAKEAASMVAGAYSTYALNNSISSSTTAGVFTPYMNYVAVDSSSSYSFGSACTATIVCLKLHNGGILRVKTDNAFRDVTTTSSTFYNLDPDGAGPQTPATFVLFFNGRLSTGGQAGATWSQSPDTTFSTDPAYIQNWN